MRSRGLGRGRGRFLAGEGDMISVGHVVVAGVFVGGGVEIEEVLKEVSGVFWVEMRFESVGSSLISGVAWW